jgi:hypothetical protein
MYRARLYPIMPLPISYVRVLLSNTNTLILKTFRVKCGRKVSENKCFFLFRLLVTLPKGGVKYVELTYV